ncbi:DUF58 domain-containing protein [Pseudorhodobacter turbinis]|uniref:DUF58 domain-containing protein n=1 Tax=Pseudorhodobacter turbinis TaxID=2500533 RepID=A0A4P8EFD0_9RHOB|nr:DUF58 domain-containing protein [Pseudorhodobacter turbinis]QCO55165.1 DUF58 domain-containing protein [Pseudorhodobacter turbinis]
MTQSLDLRARSEALGGALPALLAQAEHLAATVVLGEHGRRRAGMGDEFWQYRLATAGDPAGQVDWRRSAKSEGQFVREREWQAAQTVSLWVDASRSMQFSGDAARPPKADRAQLLALALAVLLLRGGERVGLTGDGARPRGGRGQIMHLLAGMTGGDGADYGAPDVANLSGHSRAVFFSDFLGDPEEVETALAIASDRGVRGALVQVLDPVEESFPFDGRTIFESMGGSLRHETLRAGDLRARYLDRLADRKGRIEGLARASGWHYLCHHSGQPAQSALLWLYAALERGR